MPVPLRVINGADDPVSGAHMIVRLREELPDADVVSLSGIGHYPQIESPLSVFAAYREFRLAVACHRTPKRFAYRRVSMSS